VRPKLCEGLDAIEPSSGVALVGGSRNSRALFGADGDSKAYGGFGGLGGRGDLVTGASRWRGGGVRVRCEDGAGVDPWHGDATSADHARSAASCMRNDMCVRM